MGRMRGHSTFLLCGAAAIVLTLADRSLPPKPAQAAAPGYEEVKGWPQLPAGVEMGEAAGVAVDADGHVLVFHRPGRGFDTAATELLKEPAVLEFDQHDGRLIRSWGANTFLVPHGITVDHANNVFLTDVALQQVFKFSHDGTLLFSVGEPRVGKWDATHFNQTDRHCDSCRRVVLCFRRLRQQPHRDLRQPRQVAPRIGGRRAPDPASSAIRMA